jgi:A/G-specific adenine glycosylase
LSSEDSQVFAGTGFKEYLYSNSPNFAPMIFTQTLIGWYNSNKRKLPWRETSDPYKIWLSEIILQQTRIDQGQKYYLKFIEKYPDISSLASASEQEVLKLWQGLGYYSRARNLLITARLITTNYNGKFPVDHDELLKLKGIGSYTAAAVSSLAFGQAYPVVDGNVTRFLSRYYGLRIPANSTGSKKEMRKLAQATIDPCHPGIYNQALMEFGALVCTPRNPVCESCIFKTECKAYQQDLVKVIPVRSDRIKSKMRYFNYAVIVAEEKWICIKKRTGNDIWKSLYDFPLIEKVKKPTIKAVAFEFSEKLEGTEIRSLVPYPPEYKHVLTHQTIIGRFFIIELYQAHQLKNVAARFGSDTKVIRIEEINRFPVPKLIEKFLNNYLQAPQLLK